MQVLLWVEEMNYYFYDSLSCPQGNNTTRRYNRSLIRQALTNAFRHNRPQL